MLDLVHCTGILMWTQQFTKFIIMYTSHLTPAMHCVEQTQICQDSIQNSLCFHIVCCWIYLSNSWSLTPSPYIFVYFLFPLCVQILLSFIIYIRIFVFSIITVFSHVFSPLLFFVEIFLIEQNFVCAIN